MTAKQTATDRRAQILSAAMKLAVKRGYQNVTRDEIAAAAGVSAGLVNKYFSTMPQLRRDVMRAAVRAASTGQPGTAVIPEMLTIVAQGIVARDRHALKAPDIVKNAALASYSN